MAKNKKVNTREGLKIEVTGATKEQLAYQEAVLRSDIAALGGPLGQGPQGAQVVVTEMPPVAEYEGEPFSNEVELEIALRAIEGAYLRFVTLIDESKSEAIGDASADLYLTLQALRVTLGEFISFAYGSPFEDYINQGKAEKEWAREAAVAQEAYDEQLALSVPTQIDSIEDADIEEGNTEEALENGD